jgi:amino acid adenylation domain-containing protein
MQERMIMAPCVHELIAQQSNSIPSVIAVRMGDRTLTYQELDRQANWVARRLRADGAGPETVVGVLLPRSPELIVTLLGVLKAGAAYLPLSVDDPADRTKFIIADSGAALVVDQAWREDGAAATDLVPTHTPGTEVDPGNLAYVIYTSGSTGRPKGVQVEHRQLAAYLTWCVSAYEAECGGAPVHTSPAYDLSVTSLFVPLVAGRTATLLPESRGHAAVLLGGERFGFAKVTPAHLPVLADAAEAGQQWPRRLVIGGDMLTYEALRFWTEHAPDMLIVNEYGPTETTVGCAAHEFLAGDGGTGPVPLGMGIAGSALHVLDDDLARAATGELYVGGPLVTRGYLGRPAATAAVFLPDPYSGVPGARMYRTGDLARRTRDDGLVYAGRADRELKVRGFRVHPAEIESSLCAHDNVRAAVVTAEERSGRGALIAHVVAAGGPPPGDGEIRAYLARRLPAHMIPDELHWLPELPLTPGGKVDRAALTAPAQPGPGPAASPRTPTEAAVAEVFRELLGYPPPDLDAGFAELGGDSVGAARLMARLSRAHNVDIPMDLWHMAPTVAGLARLIDTYQRHGRDAAIALHEQPELDGFSLDEEILAALEIGDSNATQ